MLARIVIYLIELYKKYISPMKNTPTCRFIPTCSQYGIEAIVRYGFFKGGFMLLWRILRCNPFAKHGYDPVE